MIKQIKITVYFLFCSSVCLRAQPPKSAGVTYAVVVGISIYKDAAIPRLNYADKDAAMFAQWLQSKAGGEVPQYNIKLLTNENATVSAVYSALDWVKKSAKENDRVCVYFSGHGDVETKNETSRGYLLAWNSPPNNYLNNAVSVNDLNTTANELTTKNKAKIILITDACHSGKMAGDFYKGRRLTAENLRLVLNNQVRLASCRENEEAAEGPFWGGGRGVFSFYLLKGLAGEAAAGEEIRLASLQQFLDSCFAADRELKLSKHAQHPVSDGSPVFYIAPPDAASLRLKKDGKSEQTNLSHSGLQSLRSAGPQPMDHFFALVAQPGFESVLPFRDFLNDSPDSAMMKITDTLVSREKIPLLYIDRNYKEDSLRREKDLVKALTSIRATQSFTDSERVVASRYILTKFNGLRESSQAENILAHSTLNHLLILQKQLRENSFSRKRFAERFVQLVHDKSQDMINAYLRGDLAELEKRQYYATGTRNYKDFIPLMKLAAKFAQQKDYLKDILELNTIYLDGVTDRLNAATNTSAADSLLHAAADKINEAMRREPYSAYIRNESGNLYFQKGMYDSALYHYNYASLLSPSWAIPYSNKIRVGLATNKLPEATAAAKVADSLQPELAFVNTNAGLVTEKTGDLLRAESYYLRAIKSNNVHYLPYERLGYLYIRSGDYERADSFLYEAQRRKDQFAVNTVVFKFGIEMGGRPDIENAMAYLKSCTPAYDTLLHNFIRYNALSESIFKIISGIDSVHDEGKAAARALLNESPDLILLHHYLGKQLFFEGNFREAIPLIKKAVANYKQLNAFKTYLRSELAISPAGKQFQKKNLKQIEDTSCLFNVLLYRYYDEREDHYLLANCYEKTGKIEDALLEYKILTGIENKRQDEQAAAVDFYHPVKNDAENRRTFQQYLNDNNLDEAQYAAKYNMPVVTGGTVMAARLLERTGRFKDAEKILLAQVKKNQAAGFSRQKKIDEYKILSKNEDTLNEYWLHINEALEKETFHFYERMTNLFPRDSYWYKTAGLFLFERLRMTYSQTEPADRPIFYDYSKTHAYPFRTGIEGPNEKLTEFGYEVIVPKIFLPGTGEELVSDTSAYDPLIKANRFLQQAVKYSGNESPDVSLIEKIADLQSWMGTYDLASNNFRYVLNLQPGNKRVRNKLVIIFQLNNELPEATTNMEILQKLGSLPRTQYSDLAKYQMMQKKYAAAGGLLQSFPDSEEKNALLTKLSLIKGDLPTALVASKKGAALYPANRSSYLYTQARIFALQKNKIHAILILRNLFKNDFNLFYLLKNDDAWESIRNTAEWKSLMSENPFTNIYSDAEQDYIEKTKYGVLQIRIPGLGK